MPKPIHILYGEEKYLVDRALEKLRTKKIGVAPDVFSYQVIEGNIHNFNELIVAIQTIPCFSPQRMVVVKEPFFLLNKKSKASEEEKEDASSSSEGVSEEQENLLRDSLDNLPVGVTVVFLIHGNIDQRRKTTNFLKERAVFSEFKPFSFWEQDKLYEWLINSFKERGYALSEDGAEVLTQIAGNSLEVLNNEIEKIVTYVGKKQKVELADIKTIVSQGDLVGFELQDALCDRDIKSALGYLTQLKKQGDSPIMVMGSIASLFRLMAQVKELAARGQDQNAIGRVLGKKPFYIKKILNGCRHYSPAELKNFIIEMHYADQKIKTGRMEQQLALEYVVSTLAK